MRIKWKLFKWIGAGWPQFTEGFYHQHIRESAPKTLSSAQSTEASAVMVSADGIHYIRLGNGEPRSPPGVAIQREGYVNVANSASRHGALVDGGTVPRRRRLPPPPLCLLSIHERTDAILTVRLPSTK